MSYHDERQIPNYWAYARNFVLQDHMFEPNWGWSLPRTSGSSPAGRRSAATRTRRAPAPAISTRGTEGRPRRCAAIRTGRSTAGPTSPTSSTSTTSPGRRTWRRAQRPTASHGPIRCYVRLKGSRTPRMWNPLAGLHRRPPGSRAPASQAPLSDFYSAAADGTLPTCPGSRPTGPTATIPARRSARGRRG